MMNISNNSYSSIELMREQLQNGSSQTKSKESVNKAYSFQEILAQKTTASTSSELKFSKHANERLASRNIDLTDEQLFKLENGAKKAKMKGINESLVMVDNLSFIVSVKNNTVITAMNDQDEQIFTNIDGAVIM